jgi:hypothetical protein
MKKTYNKDGTGVLYINDKKTKEGSPDYTGKLILDQDYGKGSEIKLSAWKKPTPMNHLISISINNYRANENKQWPKPVVDDGEVPF